MKLYCVSLKPGIQAFNLFVWAGSEDDAWEVTKEHFGPMIDHVRPHSTITEMEPERGVMCSEISIR